MRIGFFSETFLPQRNGVVTVIESFGEELARRGHEVHVYCPDMGIKSHKGMTIHSRPSFPFLPYPEFRVGIPLGPVEKLDIVHTHGPFLMGKYGLRVARKQKIPKISTFHTLLSEYVGYIWPTRFGRSLVKRLAWEYCFSHYNMYDRITTPSQAIKDMMKLDVPIDVLPAGIDTKLLKPQSRKKSREKLGLGDGKVYLCLGRLSFEKNLDFVINASKKFLDHDSRLLIVGRGPAMPRLQEQVRKLGIEDRVKFPGYVSDTEKVKYYSAADAFLMASTSETQGMVVLEAMACGCPVIAADALAIPEFVHDRKNGFLYRPNDEKQLIETIGGFDFTKKMSGKALDTAREYSVQKCTDRLEGLYELLSK